MRLATSALKASTSRASIVKLVSISIVIVVSESSKYGEFSKYSERLEGEHEVEHAALREACNRRWRRLQP